MLARRAEPSMKPGLPKSTAATKRVGEALAVLKALG